MNLATHVSVIQEELKADASVEPSQHQKQAELRCWESAAAEGAGAVPDVLFLDNLSNRAVPKHNFKSNRFSFLLCNESSTQVYII